MLTYIRYQAVLIDTWCFVSYVYRFIHFLKVLFLIFLQARKPKAKKQHIEHIFKTIFCDKHSTYWAENLTESFVTFTFVNVKCKINIFPQNKCTHGKILKIFLINYSNALTTSYKFDCIYFFKSQQEMFYQAKYF